jgi:hypothetical protein
MRGFLLVLALICATHSFVHPAHSATMRCKGFAFIGADFTCVTDDPPVRAASFCDVMNQQGGAFRWSKDDTNETKDRADLINAAGKKLCGWRR